MIRDRIESAALLALTFAAACGSSMDCLALPCPLPLATVIVTVTTSAGGPVAGAVIHGSALLELQPCEQSGSATTCAVYGPGGTDTLDVAAPGYATKSISATFVVTQAQRCGCSTGETTRLTVILTPVTSS